MKKILCILALGMVVFLVSIFAQSIRRESPNNYQQTRNKVEKFIKEKS